jgi:hypothetical protein
VIYAAEMDLCGIICLTKFIEDLCLCNLNGAILVLLVGRMYEIFMR